jgi:hypothetical protein
MTPTSLTRDQYQKLLSVCNPADMIDGSSLARVLLESQYQTGKRLCEVLNEPSVFEEVRKLLGQVTRKAGV